MIRAVFRRRQGRWAGFTISGHAGLAESGRDIVCAAVSALSQGTVMGLQEAVGVDVEPEITEEDGFLSCYLPDGLDERQQYGAQVLLETLYISLRSIEAGYGHALQVTLSEQGGENR